VLLALSLVPIAVGTLMASGAGEELLARGGLRPDSWLVDFGQQGEHIAVAGFFFLTGLICILIGRSSGGAAHVARGALGWSLVAALVLMLSRAAPMAIRGDQRGLSFAIPAGAIVLVLLTVGLSALCIAWPRRARPEDDPSFQVLGSGQEPAGSAPTEAVR
jgi:hypothetical protein